LTLTSRYGKVNQENMYQTLWQSASFCKRFDKYFGVFFSVDSFNNETILCAYAAVMLSFPKVG